MNEEVFIQYVVMGNSDQTEGRGGYVDREAFTTIEAAHDCIMTGRWGVQGFKGDGEIVERKWRVIDGIKWQADDVTIWGYRTNWQGKRDRGWLDNRDAPTEDPEFEEYVRLAKKFGKLEL